MALLAWREAKSAWFDPEARGADTGGIFTNEVNRADREFSAATTSRGRRWHWNARFRDPRPRSRSQPCD